MRKLVGEIQTKESVCVHRERKVEKTQQRQQRSVYIRKNAKFSKERHSNDQVHTTFLLENQKQHEQPRHYLTQPHLRLRAA
jgi:hypothetical protein